jgi:environmental stress-induced protein Ves
MQVLRASDYKRMPWKNGGGETVEIAVFPADAGLGDFAWRVSMATVATDGPFSTFPEIERTLSILSGAGMELTIDGQSLPVVLDRSSPPHAFPADVATHSRLIDGPITDLNVMTRRGRYAHAVSRHTAPFALPPSAALRLLLCHQGRLTVTSERDVALDPLDCLMIEPDVRGSIAVSGEATAFLIELRRL